MTLELEPVKVAVPDTVRPLAAAAPEEVPSTYIVLSSATMMSVKAVPGHASLVPSTALPSVSITLLPAAVETSSPSSKIFPTLSTEVA